MATYNDYHGLWATIQGATAETGFQNVTDLQIVVVDTSPAHSVQVDMARRLTNYSLSVPHDAPPWARTPNCKYVHRPDLIGTTASRDHIYEQADADLVLVLDCHVALRPGSLARLADWYDANPDFDGLIHGPLMYDNWYTHHTHMSDRYRGGMRGIWSTAWRTPNGHYFCVDHEPVTDAHIQVESTNMVTFYPMDQFVAFPTNDQGHQYIPGTDVVFPKDVPWPGHERVLEQAGYKLAAESPDDPEFEIPGAGMGLFSYRKSTWLGFAKHCTGFGGEEMNIHRKYKNAGRKSLCLPFLQWNHRFDRVGGTPYPAPTQAHVRNAVLWANENGESLDRIKLHFVDSGRLTGNLKTSQEEWVKLIADPVNYHVELTPKPSGATDTNNLEQLFEEVASSQRPVAPLAKMAQHYSGQVESVLAYVQHGEWEPLLASGYPAQVRVYTTDTSFTRRTVDAVTAFGTKGRRRIVEYTVVPEKDQQSPLTNTEDTADLLVLDRNWNSEELLQAMNHLSGRVKRMIIRGISGKNPGGNPQSLQRAAAIEAFVSDENNPWYIQVHTEVDTGVAILNTDPKVKPAFPNYLFDFGYGPGHELHLLLDRVGIRPQEGCGCINRMRQMDRWGVAGCEQNREVIAGWLRDNAERWGWGRPADAIAAAQPQMGADGQPLPPVKQMSFRDKLGIVARTVASGMAFKINPLDPFSSLTDMAISAAKAQGLP